LALGTDTTGTDTVDATALTNAQVVTMTGSNDATVSFANGDVTASAYAGAMTVTGTGTTGQWTTGTVTSSISSTGATIVVATAMADGQTLTTSGAGATTITGLLADLTDTSTAAQTITVADVATITLALGSDTTGTEIITATALTDGDVLTMTGANNATVASGVADLTASDYTGALAITTGNGTTIILSGTGADTIIGGTGKDVITGGNGADSITGGADADTITLTETSSAADIVKWTATDDGAMATEIGAAQGDVDFSAGADGDKIVAFTSGTDKFYFAAAGVTNAIGTEADTLITIAAGGTVTNAARFVEVTGDFGDGTTGDAIIVLNGLTTTAVAIGDSFIAFLNDGTDGYLFFVEQVSTADTIDADDVTLIGQVTSVTDVADGDFVSF
jgi:hypothetical protein